jgi:hypothetical protein
MSTRNYDEIATHRRAIGRTELVHYAGGAHRDLTAYHLIGQWFLALGADEAALKERALLARQAETRKTSGGLHASIAVCTGCPREDCQHEPGGAYATATSGEFGEERP